MDKYYTPDISEIFDGFIFEWDGGKSYDEYVYELQMGQDIYKDLKNGTIRVKYLTQEDIEELGFVYDPMRTVRGKAFLLRQKDKDRGISLLWNSEDNLVRISINTKVKAVNYLYGDFKPKSSMVFKGTIKNKSVLKQVLKLTNIIK